MADTGRFLSESVLGKELRTGHSLYPNRDVCVCVRYGYDFAASFMSLMTRHWVKGGNRHGIRVLVR